MIILALESSCDETAAAVVSMNSDDVCNSSVVYNSSVVDSSSDIGSSRVISNKIASQTSIHAAWGGVVPELASRAHCEIISSLTYEALAEAKEKAGITISDIDGIGVTNRPGLIGALLVGVSFAKALAYTHSKPLCAVNHIKGHIAAAYLGKDAPKPPFLAVAVSGGHTSVYDVRSYLDFVCIGSTRDDAAGEAIDKIGRAMGLPYPGGAAMDKLADKGNKNAYKLPNPAILFDSAGNKVFDFSFSGLKTHIINLMHRSNQRGEELDKSDIAASLCFTIADSITAVIASAQRMLGYRDIVVAGGVAANSQLRAVISAYADAENLRLHIPPIPLCGDNAAMIAAQAYHELRLSPPASPNLNAYPMSNS